MEKVFHPVSGEPMYLATENEKKIIDVALKHLLLHPHSTGDARNE